MTWTCCVCGHKEPDRPRRICPNCHIVQASADTRHKYEVLEKYCPPLSLIMRNQEIPHFFVDACAGSGIVQSWDDRAIDGSPLIMAKTRSIVENEIKDKTKKEEVRCVFIEYDEQTYTRLLKNTEPYQSFCTRLRGDTNELLPNQLNKIKDAFALIYIDPFGVGNPVIRFETVKRVLERSHTELFIHFSLEAVERSAGLLKNLESNDSTKRSQAEETVHTIDSYMNGQSWRNAWTEGVSASDRRKRLLDLYVSSLRKYYDNIKWMEMPIGRRDPDTYLIFTTRNPTGGKIMQAIMDKARRDGTVDLTDWF
jgi:three-Cys-motif partner protein